MATLEMYRHPNFCYRLRAFKVFLNETHVGNIYDGREWHGDVPEGTHIVQLRVDFSKSQAIQVTVKQVEIVRFECGCEYTVFDMLFFPLLLYKLLTRSRFCYLQKCA
jgi:hypothetical protein